MSKKPPLHVVVGLLMDDAKTQPLILHSNAVYRIAQRNVRDIKPTDLALALTENGLDGNFCCVYAAATFTPTNSLDMETNDFVFFGPDVNVDRVRRMLDDISLDPYSSLGDLDAGEYPEYVKIWCTKRGINL